MIETTESLPVKEMLATASPLIKAVVDTFIVPKLEQLRKRFSLDRRKYYVPTEQHFTEYFHRTYKKVSIINTLVFNNSQRFLKEIFIPLTLKLVAKKEQHFKIESYPEKLVEQFQKVLITDTAGMGKSTLMKKFFLDILDNKLGIPIIIELRRLTKEKKIVDEIHEQINGINKDFDSKLLLELISEGGFIFILDGYDEISLGDKDTVTNDVQKLSSTVGSEAWNSRDLKSRPH